MTISASAPNHKGNATLQFTTPIAHLFKIQMAQPASKKVDEWPATPIVTNWGDERLLKRSRSEAFIAANRRLNVQPTPTPPFGRYN
jgi:hypothetical protein